MHMHTHTSHRKRITNHTNCYYWRAFQHPCMPLQPAQGYSPHSCLAQVACWHVPASLSNCSNAAGKVGKVGILENLNEIK